MSQLALPLAWPADPRDDAFIIGPSNARAAHQIEHWGAWPVMTALLTGPRKSGRSLLARVFAAKSGGRIIDDAEGVPEATIFHAWNDAQAERRPLLVIADAPPPAWGVALPDLRSRLAASPHATIEPPDDALIRALLAHLVARRGHDLRDDLADWLVARLERSHVAVLRAAEALIEAAEARHRRLSIPLARDVLAAAGIVTGSQSLANTTEP